MDNILERPSSSPTKFRVREDDPDPMDEEYEESILAMRKIMEGLSDIVDEIDDALTST